MKHVRTFEQNNDKKYVIVRDLKILYVLDKTFEHWKDINTIDTNDIKTYTLDEAQEKISSMLRTYPTQKIFLLHFEEIELKINTNKYNL